MSGDVAKARRKIKLYCTGTLEAFEQFCLDCVKITGGDEEYGTATIAFKWWPAQRELARGVCESREIICLKPRQMGATWVVLSWFLYRAMFWDRHEYRITSVGEDESTKALRRVKFMLDNLPEWCAPRLEVSNTTTLKFVETQSWITALPATINAGRGDTLNGLLSDEAAFQTYAAQIVKSARPALEKRNGTLIVMSTANGVGNPFQQWFVEAQQKKNGFRPFFFPWTADPNRDQKWYERMVKEHGTEYCHENYPATANEAFLASGRPFFNQERLAQDVGEESPPFHDGFLDGSKFIHAARAALRVWKKPEEGRSYVLFVDPSEGLESGDPTNGYVLDVEMREIVCRIRGKLDVLDTADLAMQVSLWYGQGKGQDRRECLTAVEANNMGIAVIKRMLESGHRNMWRERNLATGEIRERVGWFTNEGTRRLALGRLQSEYRLGHLKITDRECLEEMALFAHRGPRGKAQAPPGKHDDCVMSLAGAVFIATYETPIEQELREEDDGTPLYWQKKAQESIESGQADELNRGVVEIGG